MKRFPRPVWVVYAGTFINRFGTFVVPFLALHITRLGYSIDQAAIALAAYGSGHLVASILGGCLADSLGRRATIMISMFSATVSMLLLSQAESLPALIVLAAFAGATSELYKPAASALLGDLTSPEDRVTVYAGYRFAINAGWALGPAAGGLLAQHSYTWLFVGDAATSFIYGIIAWKALPKETRQHHRSHTFRSALEDLAFAARAAAANARFVRFLGASFAAAVVFMQMPTTFGLEVRAAGLPESAYGLLLALNGVLIVLFELPISTRTRLLPPLTAITAGFALMGCGFGFLAFGNSAVALAAGMTVFTFGEMISLPVALAYAAHLAPDSLRGRFMGIYGLTWALALTVGPGTGMALFALNPVVMWSGCAVLGWFAAYLTWRDAKTTVACLAFTEPQSHNRDATTEPIATPTVVPVPGVVRQQ